jgi:hypothetical protein
MVVIGEIPYGLVKKREGYTIFDMGEFLVYAKSIEEAQEKIDEYWKGREDVKRFKEYDERPLTEEEIEHIKHCREVYDNIAKRSIL